MTNDSKRGEYCQQSNPSATAGCARALDHDGQHQAISGETWDTPCETTADGWCSTHSTKAGPVYCDQRGVEWTVKP